MGDKILKNLKQSRKAFLVEYCCVLFLILLTFGAYTNSNFPEWSTYLAGGAGIAFLGIIESSRLLLRFHIGQSKLVITKGLIKQNKKHVYYHPLGFVPDLNIHQTAFQRVMGFGTIYLKGGGENTFEIKNINNPHKILDMIEGLIERNKKV
jgi:hypothetical protein